MLQREIDGVKEKLKVLGEENKRLKLQNSELNLRKQELQVKPSPSCCVILGAEISHAAARCAETT